MSNRVITKERLAVLASVLAILVVVYLIFLYKLQIVEGEKYYEESQNNVVTTNAVTAARGNILDRYGRVLVSNKTCYNLAINESDMFYVDDADPNANILQLVNLVRDYGEDYNDELPITAQPPFEFTEMTDVDSARLSAYKKQNDLDESASAIEVLSSMRDRYEIDSNYSAEEARIIAGVRYAVNVRYLIGTSDYIFVEDADMSLISTILENNVPGITVKESFIREYNTEYAAHILGYIGMMDDTEYQSYTSLGYSADTKVGKAGVELAFEKYLHGTNGEVRTTATSDGTVVSKTYTTEPIPGNNVYLTIDIQLQEAAEQALAKGVKDIQDYNDEKKNDGSVAQNVDDTVDGAAVVAVNVKTGEPLAIASWPTYNLSDLMENYDEILHGEFQPLYNRALFGRFAPGSTFKPCVAMAALTEKTIDTNTYITCQGVYRRYEEQGYAPTCWIWNENHLTHGTDNVPLALRDSCNYFFYDVGHDLGIDKMDKYAKLFGLGEPTGIELQEDTGNMSSPDSHWDFVQEDWHIGDTMQAAIGQSDSVFTPMQMAEYCATVANGGERHTASMLKNVRSYDYSENIYERENEVLSKVDSPDYNWNAVHEGMYLVANDPNGSGYEVFQGYTASSVACKTGTSQKGETIKNTAVFMCYAPFDDPEIAVAVVVEKGTSGAKAGPIARDVLEAYFNLKSATDVTDLEGTLLK